jgi:purine-nucleoside phosphorylase
MAQDINLLDQIQETSEFIKKRVNNKLPKTAIILGTGLGAVVDHINIEIEIPYGEVPNFPVSTVQGHKGRLIFGTLGNKFIMAMQGRFHYYEGYSMQEVTFPVRVMHELGIKTLFVSNAAGGSNPTFHVGDLMVITDHINAFPENPLRGKNIPTGPRFPEMSGAYDAQLIQLADSIVKEQNISGVVHGVYYGTQGPSYETPAEYRAFHILGADAVGMSTVPEVIVARHSGIKVFGVSVITNMGLSDHPVSVSHEEVQQAGEQAGKRLKVIIKAMLCKL